MTHERSVRQGLGGLLGNSCLRPPNQAGFLMKLRPLVVYSNVSEMFNFTLTDALYVFLLVHKHTTHMPIQECGKVAFKTARLLKKFLTAL